MENSGKIERSAGILMHISSLPSPFGIGTFGKTAYEFVDFVAQARHRYWQVLPLGPTTYGDSPYQSYSAFAGNPYFVDLEMLTDDGILDRNIYEDIDWGSGDYVDYEKVYNNRFTVLHEAYKNYRQKLSESRVKLAAGLPEYKKFDNFNKTNAYWLDDYALFMALKWHFNQKSWQDWDEDIKFRTQKGMQKYKELLADEIGFWKFVQYEFDKQWKNKYGSNLLSIRLARLHITIMVVLYLLAVKYAHDICLFLSLCVLILIFHVPGHLLVIKCTKRPNLVY